ncbi:hypothetical protein SFRURICE_017060, partial [Spodoptera frugiperda]
RQGDFDALVQHLDVSQFVSIFKKVVSLDASSLSAVQLINKVAKSMLLVPQILANTPKQL